MRKKWALVCLFSGIFTFAISSQAANPDRVIGGISGASSAQLRGNVHPLAQPQFDMGAADPALQLGTITLLTVPTAAQQQALQTLLAQQQDRKSKNYHKWLTPEQYADRFGLSKSDIQQITAWLQSQGFTMIHPARGRNWVQFTGTVAQVQAALGTEIHRYSVKGQLHYANATDPKVPQALANVATGFRGLNDFKPKAMNQKRARPLYYSSTYGDFIAPGDLATTYDINPLYTAGIDGTGQKLAVMGQTDIYLTDLNKFRTGFGLSSLTCTTNSTTDVITSCSDPHFSYVLDGTDPGLSTNGDIGEADLDVEWSGAVARGAQIIYVNSTDTFTSFYYAIDNNVAPVISLSYGECEFYDSAILTPPSGQTVSHEAELMQANAQGITFVNSSGDAGAAECDFSATLNSSGLATQGVAVSYPASSPEVTGVGGTGIPLADLPGGANGSTYWGTTNGTDGNSILNGQYVPEQVWNDDLEIYQYCAINTTSKFCTQGGNSPQPGWVNITSEQAAQEDIGLSSTGGGASNCEMHSGTACQSTSAGFPQPSWQTVTVAGAPSARLSPDISFLATPNFPGYIFCTPQSEISNTTSTTSTCASGISTAVDTYLSIIGGTSASAPVFAGMVTLLNQYLAGTSSAGLGNVNPMLYQLALQNASNGAFHQVTSGDNYVYCQVGTPTSQPSALQCPSTGVIGFSAATADATTGFNLVAGLGSVDANKLAVAWAATRTSSSVALTSSTTSTYQSASVTLTATVTPSTATGNVTFMNGSTALGTASVASGVATFTTTSLPVATNSITATYNGSGTVSNSTSSAVSVTVATPFTLTPSASSFQVTQGSTVNATVALAVASGFTGTITFTCTDTAGESTCTPPPNTNASGNVTFAISTTAPTAKLQRPMDRNTRIFYAALLPGLFGLALVGSRRRSLRGLRLLSLIVLLGVSTVWMASCGGSSKSNSNPGTPKGTYTINVTGTSGSSTGTASFQLVVQ
jgi:subtilase family serine protease